LKGEGGSVDKHKARKMFGEGCRRNYGASCANLGVLWQNGEGGPRSVKKAKKYYSMACKKGNATGCANLKALK